MAAWMVWGGDRAEEDVQNGRLALDYGVREDINALDELQLRVALEDIMPDKHISTYTKYTGLILSFRDQIQIGDLVVMPRNNNGPVAIGEVTGAYMFLSNRADHTIGRPVRWLSTAVPRDRFTQDLNDEIYNNRRKTVHQFKLADIDEQLRAITGGPALDIAPASTPPPTDGMKALANDLFLRVNFLQEIVRLLNDKKQVIFQGPPGTGKTFVAQKLAEHLAEGDEERVTLVQFHPSYAYEDFIQGFRPREGDQGQVTFKLTPGPLIRIADKARNDPENHYYLIIDEINRGNLAKVFGELYFLLEYRKHEMMLQYSDKLFSMPENLYIIGTMNTADRSIALVDLALRRRFHFMEFRSSESPIKDVLRKYLERKAPDMTWVANVVEHANGLLDDRHAAIGPSYFMKKNLDEDMVKMVWEHNVLPYIEERLIGQPERLAEFSLYRLRGLGGRNAEGGVEDAEDDDC